MELDITDFFNNAAPMDYSASRAELGDSAGADTWRHANEYSAQFMLLDTDEKRDAFKAFAQGSGFSEADEFSTWSNEALNALCIQWISGDMRESGLSVDSTDEDWQAVEDNGSYAGRLFKGTDGRVYFYVGS